jgi:tryptophan synthase alpha chain
VVELGRREAGRLGVLPVRLLLLVQGADLGRDGITGERREVPPELIENVGWLRKQTPLPICIGFGISTPEHAKTLAPVADGLIVGSAVVRRIAAAGEKPAAEVLRDVGDYVASLVAALK